MSGPIRRLIGPTKARLKGYLDGLTDPHPLVDPNLSAAANRAAITDIRNNARFEATRIQRAVNILTEQNEAWSRCLRQIGDPAEFLADELRYTACAEGADGYIAVMDVADEKLAALEVLQEEIKQLLDGPTLRPVAAQQQQPQQPQQQQLPVRLPKLELPLFQGDPSSWQAFWDAFEASVHSKNISGVEKFNYLHTVVKGRAAQAIEGITINNDNYDEAITILKKRFGNTELIKESLYQQFTNLPTVHNNKATELRVLVDALEKICRQLLAVGESVNHPYLTSHVLKKLPGTVRLKLEEQYKRAEEDTWSMERLRESLQQIVVAQERSFPQEKVNHHDSTSTNKHPKGGKQIESNGGSASSSFTVTSNNKQPNPKRPQSKGGAPTRACALCGGAHYSDRCDKFRSINDRKKRLAALRKCYICLGDEHMAKDCSRREKTKCFHCKKSGSHNSALCNNLNQNQPQEQQHKSSKHGTAVHYETVATDTDEEETDQPDAEDVGSYAARPVANKDGPKVKKRNAFLLTATAFVANTKHKAPLVEARVFLDCGSQRSFVTQKLATKLKLSANSTELLTIHTFANQKPCVVNSNLVEFGLMLQNGDQLKVQANVLQTLTGAIKKTQLQPEDLAYLNGLPSKYLADPVPNRKEVFEPDVMIGLDYFLDLIQPECKKKLPSGLYLTPSKLGLLLGGNYTEEMDSVSCTAQSTRVLTGRLHSAVDQNPNLEQFWKLETLGIHDNPEINDDDQALSHFNNTMKVEDGRYAVRWPWKKDHPKLPDNYGLALGRFGTLTRRFQQDDELFQKYRKVMEDQQQCGIVEPVTDTTEVGFVTHYLPHHPVVTPSKATTKVRVVFDASAKQKVGDPSLNDCLHRGPVILPDLCGMMLRFRLRPTAITADVEKAFLQVALQEVDRDATRFFWYKDPSKPTLQNNVQVFRFCRVTFGVISSPFLLGATVKFHLQSKGTSAALQIADNTYVDNVLAGVNSIEEGQQFYVEAKELFQEAGMNLREWNSNSAEFLSSVPAVDRTSPGKTSVLGLQWHPEIDQLKINKSDGGDQMGPITKRVVLKETASVFDPLGFLAPLVLPAKVFLQKLWKNNLQWDDELSAELQKEWLQILPNLCGADQFAVPRYVGAKITDCDNQLLVFVDASGKAYAAAVYLRMQPKSGGAVCTSLLFAKTRLAPKTITLPRLELLAILIGVRAGQFVKEQLKIAIGPVVLFSDSQCALHWLRTTKPLSVFVENRVKEIRAQPEIGFRYIKTKENPADCATRGQTVDELQANSLWWFGPKWLKKPMEEWDTTFPETTNAVLDDVQQEFKKAQPFHQTRSAALHDDDEPTAQLVQLDRFSSLKRLLSSTAYVLRFLKVFVWSKLLKQRMQKYQRLDRMAQKVSTTGPLKASDMKMAKLVLERQVQHSDLQDASVAVMNGTPQKLKDQLGLQLDDDGIMRCHGRLTKADLDSGAKTPKVLPKDSHYTTLAIRNVHAKLHHAGVQQTLAAVRQEYWIPKGRSAVKKVISKCVVCRKHGGGPFPLPPMPDLPVERVTKARPFQYTGVDHFGPIWVKTADGKQKVWVCLFTCMITRAVHLEPVFDMSAQQFLHCLRRFIARRGKPATIVSDNATNFKLAQGTIDQAWKMATTDDNIINYCSAEEITWKYCTQYAPWQGGFYERMVGTVKTALRRAIGKKLLGISEFETLLAEAEAVVNSRPLTYMYDDVRSPAALRPIDFLVPEGSIGTPLLEEDPNDEEYLPKMDSKQTLLKCWRKTQGSLDNFWRLWQEEYLLSLQERFQRDHKGPRIQTNATPKVDDVVLVKDDNTPRGSWKMGRVNQLLKGHDGLIRSAEVRMSNGHLLKRPINLLYPVELSDKTEATDVQSNFLHLKRDNIVVQQPLPLNEPKKPNAKQLMKAHTTSTITRATSVALFCLVLVVQMSGVLATTCSGASVKVTSANCSATGTVVYKQDDYLCGQQVTCPVGHLNGLGSCGSKCPCPLWSTRCSHYAGKTPTVDGNLDTMLSLVQPSVCSFVLDSRCSSTPRNVTMLQIQLYNGSTYFVKELAVKWVEATADEYECVGDGVVGAMVTGSPAFCATHTCVSPGTTFCYYPQNEVIYYITDEGEFPIRAYGKVSVMVYSAKSIPLQAPLCTGCSLRCTKGGVDVQLPNGTGMMEVCSVPFCYKISMPKSKETVMLPAEVNLVKHDVTVKVWSNGYLIKNFGVSCESTPYCEMIDCYVCWARIANPQCSANLALLMFFLTLYFSSMALLVALKLATAFCRLGYVGSCLLGSCCKGCFKLLKKTRRTTSDATVLPLYAMMYQDAEQNDETDDGGNDTEPLLKVEKKAVKLHAYRHKKKLPYLSALALAICLFAPGTDGCSEVTTLTAQQSVCTVQKTGAMDCIITETSRLALSPQGQDSCLLIKDPNNQPIGTLSIQVEKIQLQCQHKNEYWTRSFKMKDDAVKRCSTAGSCTDNKCDDVNINSKISELDGPANDHPGFTYCAESCGGLVCGCFWKPYACLYYRTFAKPLTDTTYEVFSCPVWVYSVNVTARLTTDSSTEKHQFTLTPGVVAEWKNLQLTLVSMITPPTPLLGQKFLTDGDKTMMVEASASGQPVSGTVGAMQCASRSKAEAFDCYLPHDSCLCQAYHKTVSCSCVHHDLEALFDKVDSVLPLISHGVSVSGQGSSIALEYQNIAALELQITMAGMQLSTKSNHNICKVTVKEFGGCYSCLTGAELQFRCITDFGDAVAHATCASGAKFSTVCTAGGISATTRLNFDHAKIDEECNVRCPAGETSFRLSTTLVFVERERFFNISNIIAGRDITSAWAIDFGFLTGWLGAYWMKIMGIVALVAVVVLATILLLPLLLQCLPALLMMLARMMVKAVCRRKKARRD